MSFLLTSLFIVNAKIDFPAGLDVEWQGNTFGNIKMDAVQVTGDVGATLDIDSTFKVINPGTLPRSVSWYFSMLTCFLYFLVGPTHGGVI